MEKVNSINGKMAIEKKNFVSYTEDRKNVRYKVISLRLSREEQAELVRAQRILQQPKLGTVIKQLTWLGLEVIHDQKLAKYMKILSENKRRNRDRGITPDMIE